MDNQCKFWNKILPASLKRSVLALKDFSISDSPDTPAYRDDDFHEKGTWSVYFCALFKPNVFLWNYLSPMLPKPQARKRCSLVSTTSEAQFTLLKSGRVMFLLLRMSLVLNLSFRSSQMKFLCFSWHDDLQIQLKGISLCPSKCLYALEHEKNPDPQMYVHVSFSSEAGMDAYTDIPDAGSCLLDNFSYVSSFAWKTCQSPLFPCNLVFSRIGSKPCLQKWTKKLLYWHQICKIIDYAFLSKELLTC